MGSRSRSLEQLLVRGKKVAFLSLVNFVERSNMDLKMANAFEFCQIDLCEKERLSC